MHPMIHSLRFSSSQKEFGIFTQGVDLDPAHQIDILDPAHYVCVIQHISSRCFVPTELSGITAMQSQVSSETLRAGTGVDVYI